MKKHIVLFRLTMLALLLYATVQLYGNWCDRLQEQDEARAAWNAYLDSRLGDGGRK